MTDAPLRVALLARAGVGRDQLQRALQELGADVAMVADPNDLQTGGVLSAGVKAVLVAMEPAIEKAIERLEADLWSPDLNVLFDDAQGGATRSGWDQARWARHLAAKLLGRDLLPPADAADAALPDAGAVLTPGAPPSPASLAPQVHLETLAEEGDRLAGDIPAAYDLAAENVLDIEPQRIAEHLPSLSLADDADVAKALSSIDAHADGAELRLPTADRGVDGLNTESMDLSDADLAAFADFDTRSLDGLDRASSDAGIDPFSFKPVDNSPYSRPSTDSEKLLSDFNFDPDAQVRFSGMSGDDSVGGMELDADLAALAAQLDDRADAIPGPVVEALPPMPEPVEERTPTPAPAASPAPRSEAQPRSVAAPVQEAKPSLNFGNLSLVDADVPAMPPPAAIKEAAKRDFIQLASGLSLEGDALPPPPAPREPGAVLVLAGMGGPDAVRQLLRSLPTNLHVPVLLVQQLDGARHDRLAEQLGKVSVLPVKVATPHGLLAAAEVYVLPDGVCVDMNKGAFRPGTNLVNLVAGLIPDQTVIVVLSGADPAALSALKTARDGGAQVFVQALDGCFEPVVAKALHSDGAPAMAPGQIAQTIAGRFAH